MKVWTSLAVVAVGAVATVNAVTWNLKDTINGNSYMDKFDYFTDKDPTNGLVVYQNQQQAQQLNLTYAHGEDFVIRVDTTKTRAEGRPSVRLQSKANYGDSVIILQMSHIPTGCAVWPAFWTVTSDVSKWPTGGEIDIMENVNDQYAYNLASLHVKDQCSVANGDQSGTTVFPNCNYQANEQSGCRIAMNGTKSATWGSKVNSKGGGVVAMHRDFSQNGKGIRMWYWDRTQNMPSDISKPGKTVNPDSWGTPAANFGKLSCTGGADGASQFDDHKIVFDITLCGDWADGAYNQTQCPSKYQACSNQVGNAGSSFDDAYWQVQNLYVYQTDSASSAASLALPMLAYLAAAALVGLTLFA